jgi:hypothetical protein
VNKRNSSHTSEATLRSIVRLPFWRARSRNFFVTFTSDVSKRLPFGHSGSAAKTSVENAKNKIAAREKFQPTSVEHVPSSSSFDFRLAVTVGFEPRLPAAAGVAAAGGGGGGGGGVGVVGVLGRAAAVAGAGEGAGSVLRTSPLDCAIESTR